MLSSEDAKLTSHCTVTDFYMPLLLNIYTTGTSKRVCKYFNGFGNVTINWLILIEKPFCLS